MSIEDTIKRLEEFVKTYDEDTNLWLFDDDILLVINLYRQLQAENCRLRAEIYGMSIPKIPEDMDIENPKTAWVSGYEDAIMEARNRIDALSLSPAKES